MPIDAVLQNIGGTRKLDSVLDKYGDLHKCLPIEDTSFPLLQYVDPYGDTIFNPRQMPQLLSELELTMSRCSGEEPKLLLTKVRELAEKCRDARHLYLRFVGD
jgi:hypothetical protein